MMSVPAEVIPGVGPHPAGTGIKGDPAANERVLARLSDVTSQAGGPICGRDDHQGLTLAGETPLDGPIPPGNRRGLFIVEAPSVDCVRDMDDSGASGGEATDDSSLAAVRLNDVHPLRS